MRLSPCPPAPGGRLQASMEPRSGLSSAFQNRAQASAHCQLFLQPLIEMPSYENLFRDTFVDGLTLQGIAADALHNLDLQEARAFAPAGD